MAVTVQGAGVAVGSTDRVNLMLKQFAGEVIAEFDKKFKARALTRTKALKPGRKADVFPAIGRATTKYHTAGENMLVDAGYLQAILNGERLIYADRPNTANIVLDNLEEKLSYWDDRSAYVKQLAYGLASDADKNVIRTLCRSARRYVSQPYTGAPQGEYIVPVDVGGATGTSFTAAQLVDAFARAQRLMDEKDVPEDDRFSFIAPATLELLLKSSAGRDHINQFYNPGGNGSIAKGVIYELYGFKLVKTNNIPTDNLATRLNQIGGSGNSGNDYRIDMRNTTDAGGGNLGSATRAVCFQREACGTVLSADIGMESEYKIELQGDLVVCKYAMGHGELRPECVVEIACNTKPAAP